MWVYTRQTTILENFPLNVVYFAFLAILAECGVQKKGGFREAYLERSVSRLEAFLDAHQTTCFAG